MVETKTNAPQAAQILPKIFLRIRKTIHLVVIVSSRWDPFRFSSGMYWLLKNVCTRKILYQQKREKGGPLSKHNVWFHQSGIVFPVQISPKEGKRGFFFFFKAYGSPYL